MLYSERVNLAIKRATLAHDGQFRRNSALPYIAHPFAVALLSQRFIDDENVFIASLLHDVLEDVPERVYSSDDIYHDFGQDVLNIVRDVTEPSLKVDAWRAWQVHKDAYIAHLGAVNDRRALIVCACDKIHNMTEMLADYEREGEHMWNSFAADRQREVWFLVNVLNMLRTKADLLPPEVFQVYEEKLTAVKRIAQMPEE